MDQSPAKTTEPASKRRRIAVACNQCRLRKTRCDGARPRCSVCADLRFDCTYQHPGSGTNIIVGKEYLSDLEGRLKAVEETLRSIQPNGVVHPSSENDFTSETIGRSGLASTVNDNASPHTRAVRLHGECSLEPPGNENSVDGMGALAFADEEDCGFFGTSSNIAFMRHISHAVAYLRNMSHPWTPKMTEDDRELEGGYLSVSRPSSPFRLEGFHSQKQRVDIYALPSGSETMELIQFYFNDTGMLFPYIHEQTFLEVYAQMKRDNFTKVQRTWLGLLNMVLAMATNTSLYTQVNSKERTARSEVFYQRALGLCNKQMLRGTRLELVQFLLLMVQYLQGTQKAVETWTIHGLAVKAAFQLGLHSDDALALFPPIEREVRKRVWYGCVILDRTLSMTFGRPANIPDYYVRAEAPRPYDQGLSISSMDPRTMLSLEFFLATISLYKIMWQVIDTLYGQNLGFDQPQSTMDIVSRMFPIQNHLQEWEQNLPESFWRMHAMNASSISSSEPLPSDSDFLETNASPPIERFGVVLRLRFLNLRILLHRPLLVKLLDNVRLKETDRQKDILLQQMGPTSVQTCVESSIEIISIVHAIVFAPGRKRNLLGAWWFTLYYTFNAAIVLFASLLVVCDSSVRDDSMLGSVTASRKALLQVCTALRKLDSDNRVVMRCNSYVSQLNQILDSLSSNFPFLDIVEDAVPMVGEEHQNSTFDDPTSFINEDLSPLGIDLGEFMLDSNIDFLNSLFGKGKDLEII